MNYKDALKLIKEQIRGSKSLNESPHDASWSYETGVLISREVAETIIDKNKALRSKLSEANKKIEQLEKEYHGDDKLEIIKKENKESGR